MHVKSCLSDIGNLIFGRFFIRRSYLVFQQKGCSDMYVALSTTPIGEGTPTYELRLNWDDVHDWTLGYSTLVNAAA